MKAQIIRGHDRDLSSLASAMDHVKSSASRFNLFAPLLAEADALELATVTAMGVRPPTHTQSDEGRSVGGSFVIDFDPEVCRDIVAQWRPVAQQVRKENKLNFVIPNGTSLGWPFLFRDSDDRVRTFVLGVLALAIETDKRRGASLDDVYGQLQSVYGPRLMVPGWRLQHTAKPIPAYASGSFRWTQNVEPRRRLIVMVDKIANIFNREPSKIMIQTALRLPQHDQGRPYIKGVFDRWKKTPGTKTVAVDVSGFDNGVGGPNLVHLLSMMNEITGVGTHRDLVSEVSAPMLVPFGNDVFQTTSQVTPQLPSGASFTTSVGLLAGDYIARKLAKILGLSIGPLPSQMEYLNWGDDFAIRIPAAADVERAFKALSTHTGLEFDFEPTLKYLGFNYGSGVVQAHEGYSMGRLILKTLYPERPVVPPFSRIGYVARLQFVHGDPEFYHALFTQNFWDPRLGPPFQYKERHSVLEEALRASVTAMDYDRDTLNFLLHGLQPSEAATTSGHLLDSLGVDFDFATWIGHSYIDLTDPMAVLRSETSPLLLEYAQNIKIIANTGIAAVPNLISALAARYNWRVSNSGLSPVI
jgi:hypothetical protein